MARLRLTIHDVDCFESATSANSQTIDLAVSTEKETASTFFQSGDSKYGYTLTLVDFSFKKKMYQPTEIIADIQISMTAGPSADWKSIGKDALVTLFKNKKVTLEEMTAKESNQPDKVVFTIGDDYYVQEVQPRYKTKSLYVALRIYSLDKMMTFNPTCRSFVGKKLLADILTPEMKLYTIPYEDKDKVFSCTDNLKNLYFNRKVNNEREF